MNKILDIVRKTIIGFSMAGLFVSSAAAVPLVVPQAPAQMSVIQVSGDCYAMGQQEAARRGGQLARAEPETRGGQQVCVIVVLMPAKDGQRPRRDEIVLPMG